MFHTRARLVGIGGDEVDVQLDRVGSGLLQPSRVLRPAAHRDPVQACDHGDLEFELRRLQVAQVGVGAGVVVLERRHVGGRLCEAVRSDLERAVDLHLLVLDLLLEQGREHDRRRPGVLELSEGFDPLAERRGRGHDRVRQFQTQVARAEVAVMERILLPRCRSARPLAARGERPRAPHRRVARRGGHRASTSSCAGTREHLGAVGIAPGEHRVASLFRSERLQRDRRRLAVQPERVLAGLRVTAGRTGRAASSRCRRPPSDGSSRSTCRCRARCSGCTRSRATGRGCASASASTLTVWGMSAPIAICAT